MSCKTIVEFHCRVIYDKIDRDTDGYVSETELVEWIKHVQNRYIEKDTERQWTEYGVKDGDSLEWSAYKKRTYGFDESGEYTCITRTLGGKRVYLYT